MFSKIVEAIWKLFCSLRLTVVLIASLTAGCFWGMFFDQTKTLAEHKEEWSTAIWQLYFYETLELNDVFHSWWFGFLIIFLALNLIACSAERLPKIWIDIHEPIRELSDRQLRGIKHKTRLTIPKEAWGQFAQVAQDVMSMKGRHVFVSNNSLSLNDSNESGASMGAATTYFFNERDRYARTGVYLVHIALLIIMFSSFMTTYQGIDGMLMIVEGSGNQYVRVRGPGGFSYRHDLGFMVRCDDFRLKTFTNGAPLDFESDLAIYRQGGGLRSEIESTIQVNHPLEYEGYTFYQASYQPLPGAQAILLDVCENPGADPAALVAYRSCKESASSIYKLNIGEKIRAENGFEYMPVNFREDYMGLGAAVRIQRFAPNGGPTERFWVFRNYPKFDEQVRRGPNIVGFRGFDQRYATGIQVGKSPYINIVFVGFILMFSGMYMAFFMSQRRYWIRARERDGEIQITLAGAARRHQESFAEEYKRFESFLRKSAERFHEEVQGSPDEGMKDE